MKPIICIAGPTASGKSAWAISLAKSLSGEIINADALQVYRDLQVLSARPTEDDMGDVSHHMFGHIDGSIRYSAGEWLREVQPVILDILVRGKTPILVGGTGLYFKGLTEGLAAVPTPDASALADAQRILDDEGISVLRDRAETLDPKATAKVLGNDPQRLLRIVSVATGTGKPLSQWQADTKPIIPKTYWRGAVILPERASLYERINHRYAHMVKNGGLDEAKRVMKRDLPSDIPMMKAIGLSPLIAYLRGDHSLESALETAKRDTRRFAKRQYTWFRGQAKDWPIVTNVHQKETFCNNLPDNID